MFHSLQALISCTCSKTRAFFIPKAMLALKEMPSIFGFVSYCIDAEIMQTSIHFGCFLSCLFNASNHDQIQTLNARHMEAIRCPDIISPQKYPHRNIPNQNIPTIISPDKNIPSKNIPNKIIPRQKYPQTEISPVQNIPRTKISPGPKYPQAKISPILYDLLVK